MISPDVAADTAKVQAKLETKNQRRAFRVQDRGAGGGALPEANGAVVGHFVRQVISFKEGTGPGPTGLKVQFIRKELTGEEGVTPCAHASLMVIMLFVERHVPNHLRCCFGGGSLVGIGEDDNHWTKMRVQL